MIAEQLRARLASLVARVGGKPRAMALAAGVGVVVLVLAFSWWAATPAWVPLYSNVPLESVEGMTKTLDEVGITYRLDGAGTTLAVPAPDMARARVALAGAGMPASGRPGLELFDQPAWGMTDFTQRINYRRALEGELERTIGKMSGVKSAQVHLAMSDQSALLRGNRPTAASVVLELPGGGTPEPAVVKGIAQLVASSVDGVRSDNVMVLDNSGRLLSLPADAASPGALSNRQLEMQREVESHLESKAGDLVTQALGAGNARVQVSADLSFDRVERTTQSVDPDRQALASEQHSDIVPGAQGGAGSQTASATYENSRSVETSSTSGGTLRRLTVAVLVADRLLPGKTAEFAPRPPAELERIQSLVGSAVGLDTRRGDVISVVSMPFAAAAAPVDAAPTPWELLHEFGGMLLGLVGLMVALFVGLKVVRALRPDAAQLAASPALAALPASAGTDDPRGELAAPDEPEFILPPAAPTVRDRVAEVVESEPDVAARLVRAWLKEA